MLLIVENIVDILREVAVRIVRFAVEAVFEDGLVRVFDAESQRMLQPFGQIGIDTLAGDPDGEGEGQARGFFHSAARSYE